jgi:hypothetical protein
MLWHEVILEQDLRRHRYEKKTGRRIPVAVLTPTNPSHDITLICPVADLPELGPAAAHRRPRARRGDNLAVGVGL